MQTFIECLQDTRFLSKWLYIHQLTPLHLILATPASPFQASWFQVFVCKNSFNYHSIIWSRLLPLKGCTNNNVRKVTQLKIMCYKWFGIFFFSYFVLKYGCVSQDRVGYRPYVHVLLSLLVLSLFYAWANTSEIFESKLQPLGHFTPHCI